MDFTNRATVFEVQVPPGHRGSVKKIGSDENRRSAVEKQCGDVVFAHGIGVAQERCYEKTEST